MEKEKKTFGSSASAVSARTPEANATCAGASPRPSRASRRRERTDAFSFFSVSVSVSGSPSRKNATISDDTSEDVSEDDEARKKVVEDAKTCSGVFPSTSRASRFAPKRRNRFNVSSRPRAAATCAAVCPSPSAAFTSQCMSSTRNAHVSACPLRAAKWSGVDPTGAVWIFTRSRRRGVDFSRSPESAKDDAGANAARTRNAGRSVRASALRFRERGNPEASRTTRNTSTCPFSAAKCVAVAPIRAHRASRSAPNSQTSARSVSARPNRAARIAIVSPDPSGAFSSIAIGARLMTRGGFSFSGSIVCTTPFVSSSS